MTPAEARERYGVTVSDAEPGDRLEADDGTALVVLESARDGTRRVVHADLFEFSRTEIVAAGAAGLLLLLGILALPLAGGFWVGLTASNLAVTVGAVAAGVGLGFAGARVVLYRTVVHDWVFRFLEWYDHKTLVEAYRERGEPA